MRFAMVYSIKGFFCVSQKPVAGLNKKTTCCLCCKRGPIALRCQLLRSAYVCGESIKLKATIDNQGEEDVRLKVRLFQVFTSSFKIQI